MSSDFYESLFKPLPSIYSSKYRSLLQKEFPDSDQLFQLHSSLLAQIVPANAPREKILSQIDNLRSSLTPEQRLAIQEKGYATVEIHATDQEVEDLRKRIAHREVESMMFEDSEEIISEQSSAKNKIAALFIEDETDEKADMTPLPPQQPLHLNHTLLSLQRPLNVKVGGTTIETDHAEIQPIKTLSVIEPPQEKVYVATSKLMPTNDMENTVNELLRTSVGNLTDELKSMQRGSPPKTETNLDQISVSSFGISVGGSVRSENRSVLKESLTPMPKGVINSDEMLQKLEAMTTLSQKMVELKQVEHEITVKKTEASNLSKMLDSRRNLLQKLSSEVERYSQVKSKADELERRCQAKNTELESLAEFAAKLKYHQENEARLKAEFTQKLVTLQTEFDKKVNMMDSLDEALQNKLNRLQEYDAKLRTLEDSCATSEKRRHILKKEVEEFQGFLDVKKEILDKQMRISELERNDILRQFEDKLADYEKKERMMIEAIARQERVKAEHADNIKHHKSMLAEVTAAFHAKVENFHQTERLIEEKMKVKEDNFDRLESEHRMRLQQFEEIQKNRERINLKLLKEIVHKEKTLDQVQYKLRECQREIAVTKIIRSTGKPVAADNTGMIQEILKKLQEAEQEKQEAPPEISHVEELELLQATMDQRVADMANLVQLTSDDEKSGEVEPLIKKAFVEPTKMAKEIVSDPADDIRGSPTEKDAEFSLREDVNILSKSDNPELVSEVPTVVEKFAGNAVPKNQREDSSFSTSSDAAIIYGSALDTLTQYEKMFGDASMQQMSTATGGVAYEIFFADIGLREMLVVSNDMTCSHFTKEMAQLWSSKMQSPLVSFQIVTDTHEEFNSNVWKDAQTEKAVHLLGRCESIQIISHKPRAYTFSWSEYSPLQGCLGKVHSEFTPFSIHLSPHALVAELAMLLEERTPFRTQNAGSIPEFCIQLNEDEFLLTSDANKRFLSLKECGMMTETYVGQINAHTMDEKSNETSKNITIVESVKLVNVSKSHLNTSPGSVIAEKICPVSFRGPKGPHAGNIGFVFEGDLYFFSNAHVFEMFKANASQFLPAYGGFCATAMSMGIKAPVDWRIFTTNMEGLFLFHNEEAKKNWERNPQALKKRADENFGALSNGIAAVASAEVLSPPELYSPDASDAEPVEAVQPKEAVSVDHYTRSPSSIVLDLPEAVVSSQMLMEKERSRGVEQMQEVSPVVSEVSTPKQQFSLAMNEVAAPVKKTSDASEASALRQRPPFVVPETSSPVHQISPYPEAITPPAKHKFSEATLTDKNLEQHNSRQEIADASRPKKLFWEDVGTSLTHITSIVEDTNNLTMILEDSGSVYSDHTEQSDFELALEQMTQALNDMSEFSSTLRSSNML